MVDPVCYYNDRWSAAPAQMTAAERERADIALAALPAKRPLRILEIGSGRGLFSVELAQHGSVTSLDLSPAAIDAASKRWAALPIEFLAGDFLHMELTGGYDVVVALEVIEHVVDQRRFMERVTEQLAPGGVAILTTPQRWVARHWVKQPGSFLQPVENWVSRRELSRLVGSFLEVKRLWAFCFNGIYAGPFRILNAPKINRYIPIGRLERLLGWGMHLAVVARRAERVKGSHGSVRWLRKGAEFSLPGGNLPKRD